jgi:uncharacterized protein (DUF1015 family)
LTWLIPTILAVLIAVVGVLCWVVYEQILMARRLSEFLRNEDLEQRKILQELIRVMTEQAKRYGYEDLHPQLIGIQKEVSELARLFAEYNSRLLADSHHGRADSRVCGSLEKRSEAR